MNRNRDVAQTEAKNKTAPSAVIGSMGDFIAKVLVLLGTQTHCNQFG